jgi:hypothetical protein
MMSQAASFLKVVLSIAKNLRDNKFDSGSCLKALEYQSTGLNLFNAIVGSIDIFVSGHAQWRSFGRNGVERVKGRSYPKPLVRADPWSFGAQWSVMDQAARLVDDKEVKEDHGAGASQFCASFSL